MTVTNDEKLSVFSNEYGLIRLDSEPPKELITLFREIKVEDWWVIFIKNRADLPLKAQSSILNHGFYERVSQEKSSIYNPDMMIPRRFRINKPIADQFRDVFLTFCKCETYSRRHEIFLYSGLSEGMLTNWRSNNETITQVKKTRQLLSFLEYRFVDFCGKVWPKGEI